MRKCVISCVKNSYPVAEVPVCPRIATGSVELILLKEAKSALGRGI